MGAGEVHGGLLGSAKPVDFIPMAKGLPASAESTLGACSEGSSPVSPRLEIASAKRPTGLRAWPEGIRGKATGLRGARRAELGLEPRTPGAPVRLSLQNATGEPCAWAMREHLPPHIRGLSIPRRGYLRGSWNQLPHGYCGMTIF